MDRGRRRALRLVGGCLVGVASAGCASGPSSEASEPSEREPSDGDPEEYDYDRCHRTKIPYHELPEEVRAEVDAARESGEYRSTSLRLDDAIDVPEAYIATGRTVYDPQIEDGGDGTKVLTLTEVDAVKRSRPRSLLVKNVTDREHEVRVELTGVEPVLREQFTLEPGEIENFSVTDKFGSYDLIVETPNSDKETLRDSFVVDDLRDGSLDVEITESGIDASELVTDRAPCTWDTEETD
jgi:hypothetical protein